MNHTPGPWLNSQSAARFAVPKSDTISQEETEANAQLIEAAPDLAEALRELTDDIADRFDMQSSSTNPGMRDAVSNARAALAKAGL